MKFKGSLLRFAVLISLLFDHQQLVAAGTWTNLAHTAPGGVSTMLLLPDGTVMATGANIEASWYRLTPDNTGSYVNGTWSTLAPMHDTRLYFSSVVLTNGQVFVAGGEYGTGNTNAEVYNPLSNVWTQLPPSGQNFRDVMSKILPDGRVLISPDFPNTFGGTSIFDPSSNSWISGGTLVRGNNQAEASWVKLPDDSILTIDPYGTNSERYIPSLNQWINDATVPVSMFDTNDHEIGAALLLADGRAFFVGATGNTVFYTPSGNTDMGSWQAGPVIPNAQATPDAPAAMMVNGKILCATSPQPTSATHYPSPTSFYEFDPVANSFTQVNGPTGTTFSTTPYAMRMLDLPDGSVLLSASGSQLYTYRPTGPPLAAGKPTITAISTNATGWYHLTGMLLNGISEGAAYGDDAQMDSNYPLIRMTNTVTGKVYYARTFNWNSTSVMTGSNPVGTDFIIPTNVPSGVYSLVAVANGISSDPVPFAVEWLQIAPTNNITSLGQPGGPFTTTTQNFTVTNYGGATQPWSLGNTSAWLNVSPTSGTLLPGGAAATVTASLNANASNLLVGTYSANLVFTNRTTLTTQTRIFTLIIQSPANGGFETGDFTAWTPSGNTNTTLITNLSAYVHSGTYGLMAGPTGSMGFLSQTITTIPGQNYLLSFWLTAPTAAAVTNQFITRWNNADLYNNILIGQIAWTNLQFLVTATANSTQLQFGFSNQLASASFGLDDVSITPVPPAVFQSAIMTSNSIQLTWSAMAGLAYQVQYQTNLLQNNWITTGSPITATNSTVTTTDNPGADPQRFYRLLVLLP
jgi:hypothetical protein